MEAIEEITMEKIQEMKREIDEEQQKLNERRRKVLELEKKYLRSAKINEVDVYQISPADMEKAKDISIREVHLAVDFSTRFIHRVGDCNIKNLKELYEWIICGKPYSVRYLGEGSIKEAKNLLQDIPGIIEMIYQRRKNIEENNMFLTNLTEDYNFAMIMLKKHNIKTLSELYYAEAESCKGIFPYNSEGKLENKVIDLLRRF